MWILGLKGLSIILWKKWDITKYGSKVQNRKCKTKIDYLLSIKRIYYLWVFKLKK